MGSKLASEMVGINSNVSLALTNKVQLIDRGSIRSSLRYGLSTPYRLTIRNSAGLSFDNDARLTMFSLNMVDYSMSFLSLST